MRGRARNLVSLRTYPFSLFPLLLVKFLPKAMKKEERPAPEQSHDICCAGDDLFGPHFLNKELRIQEFDSFL